jgi:hypothetical protein
MPTAVLGLQAGVGVVQASPPNNQHLHRRTQSRCSQGKVRVLCLDGRTDEAILEWNGFEILVVSESSCGPARGFTVQGHRGEVGEGT